MKTLLFETDTSAEFPMAGIDSTEAAGVVTAVFSFFQPFHTGSVNPVKLVFDILPDFR